MASHFVVDGLDFLIQFDPLVDLFRPGGLGPKVRCFLGKPRIFLKRLPALIDRNWIVSEIKRPNEAGTNGSCEIVA